MSVVWNRTADGLCELLNWDKSSIELLVENLKSILDNWEDEEE